MFLKIYKVTILIFISVTIQVLRAKPAEKSRCLTKETKCDNLIWTQVNNSEWTVKKIIYNESSSGGLMVWWPSLGRCVDLTKEKVEHLCSNGEPILNSQMEGMCKCIENAGVIEGKEGCHLYYDQGPCPKGQVVTFDDIMKKAVCSKDFCAKENENATEFNKRYVPVNGICYNLESNGPCEFNEYLMISSNLPKCSLFSVGVQTFASFPKTCMISAKDKYTCRIDISADTEDDRAKYNSQLMKDLNN